MTGIGLSHPLRQCRDAASQNPIRLASLALMLAVLASVDILEVFPLFTPVVTWPPFHFIHETHDLLALFVALYVAYRWYPALGVGFLIVFLAAYVPYFFAEFPQDLPELARRISVAVVGLIGIRLTAQLRQLNTEVGEKGTQLSFLKNLTSIMNSSLNIDDVYRTFAERLGQSVSVDRFAIVWSEGDRARVFSYSVDEHTPDAGRPAGGGLISLERTGLSWLMERRAPHYQPDLAPDGEFTTDAEHQRAGLRSYLRLPLFHQGKVIGALNLGSKKSDAYGAEDRRLLEELAAQITPAVAHARLYESQKRRAEQLAALHQVSQAVSQSLDLEAVAGLALEATLGALGLDVGTIRYVDETTQEVVLLTQRGLPEEMLEERRARPRVKIGESLAGRVAQSRQIMVVDDFSHDGTSVYETNRTSGFESFIGIPLKVKGRVVGTVSAVSRRRYTLPQAAVEMIESLGSLVGMAIANARLHTVTDAALQQRAAEMESIISGMGEGLMVVNAQRTVDYCNKAAEELLGLNSADFLGQPVEVFNNMLSTRIAEPEEWRRVLAAELGKGDGQPRFHFVVQHPERREIDAALFPIESGGRRLGTGAVLRDVTRERELDRMKTEFISHASHELRTPLSVIHGFIELLLRYKASPADQRAWLEEAHQESQRLTSIVDDLLNVSRIESGRLALNLQRVALESLAVDLVHQISVRYPSHSVYCDIPEGFPAIWADAERLAYVLHNLMDNAAKYSPHGGPVTVSARWDEESSQAVIAVADQGLGIPKREMSHLFARFHRIRRPETEGIRGTGLGLYIAKSLVEMMGGRIWAESSLNEGSTFHVSLTLAEAALSEDNRHGKLRRHDACSAGDGQRRSRALSRR